MALSSFRASASPLPLSAKALSSHGAGSSSVHTSRDGKTSELRLDMGIDTPSVVASTDAPFVLFDNLERELQDVSQRSATMSFWFPRQHENQNQNQNPHEYRRRRRHHTAVERDATTAIQPGSPIDIFACQSLGLLVNHAALGFFDGVLPLLAQVLYTYGSDEATQLATARQAALLVRVLLAVLSDVLLPASKSRRRVFLVLGWLVLLVLGVVLAVLTSSASLHVPSTLTQYLPVLLALPVGHVLASVSADALMVEYAHREDAHERGCVQMLLLATRIVGELVGRSSMSTGNAPTTTSQRDCRGELDCVFELQYTFTACAAVALVALLSSAFTTRVPSRRRLALQGHAATTTVATKLQHVWTFLQHPMYLGFVVVGFVQAASVAWASPSARELATTYVHVPTPTQWVSDGVSLSLRMVAALMMMSLWRNTHWRLLSLALVGVSTLVSRVPGDVLVLLDTTRNTTTFLAFHHVASCAESALAMVRMLVAVEMAMPTMEATSYALTLSTFDVGTIVGSFVAERLVTMRPSSTTTSETASVEQWLLIVCVAMYVLRVTVDVGSLRLLPIQKSHVHEQRARVTENKPSFASGLALALLLVLVVAAAAFNAKALATGTAGVPWTTTMLLS